MKTRLVKYFLRKWYELDNSIGDLSPIQEVQIKTLYSMLQELKDDELDLLAVKYRTEKKPPKTDKVVADELGIPVKEYVSKRVEIELSLVPITITINERYQEEMSKAVNIEHGLRNSMKKERSLRSIG